MDRGNLLAIEAGRLLAQIRLPTAKFMRCRKAGGRADIAANTFGQWPRISLSRARFNCERNRMNRPTCLVDSSFSIEKGESFLGGWIGGGAFVRHGLETMTRLRWVFEERSRGRKIAVERGSLPRFHRDRCNLAGVTPRILAGFQSYQAVRGLLSQRECGSSRIEKEFDDDC